MKGNIGFISTRFSGLDGVSLETEKWAKILEEEGFECYYFAGEIDRPEKKSFIVEEAHFRHPNIEGIFNECFGKDTRENAVTRNIHETKKRLKTEIHNFIDKFKIDLLIVENSLAIPLNIPLGIAITEFISETKTPTIAHHHDFYWERKKMLVNAVGEYLHMAFPPVLPSIRHVVINSYADRELSYRTGISSTIIPNVLDFEKPLPPLDEYASDVRENFGIREDELLILQPTRVVPRKGIEHAIELTKRLGMKAKLVISHASGDEGFEYEQRLREYSKMLGVDTLFVSKRINERRKTKSKGEKVYTIWDIYPHADLVTYPSTYEGFGNAFLEAIYCRKPIVVNKYVIYTLDIEPKGFDVITLDGYVNEEAVRKTKEILADSEKREKMVKHNYKLARRYFSLSVLRRKLKNLIREILYFDS
ncbi:glycosyltransferase family 4 protein [candidate division WOR-3 bacterium]|nr:glycosyltransferase family 4 protein [candidate division WOR-3 bacterium]